MIEQQQQVIQNENIPKFGIYKNKKSKMNESILIDYSTDQNKILFHAYAIITPDNYFRSKSEIIDLRKSTNRYIKSSPLRIISQIKIGSLSFIRFFIENPSEKKYEQKIREKYPNKKRIRMKSFPPLLVLVAHYCNQYSLSKDLNSSTYSDKLTEFSNHFDELLQEEIHPILRTLGKPLYLKGEFNLVNFHQTREISEVLIKKLANEKLLHSINNQKQYSFLIPVVKGIRNEISEQKPLYQEQINPQALSHIINADDKLIPINIERFPIVIVGEPNIRRNLILNILNNANARFLIFDSKENYGRLAMINPRIRGYVLNKNFFLDILCSEGEQITRQVYAYWFAKIIAYITNLRSDLIKLIEANLLRAYFDEHNQAIEEYTYFNFANGELTSEGSNARRSDLSNAQNALYTLSTYREISHKTMIGNSPVFESLFDTKGTIIQFANNDDQLTKIAYLFTLLKLRSTNNKDPKIIVLENLDDIIGSNGRLSHINDLTDLILGLVEDYYVILGIRSPSKIQDLFKNTRSKFINRLLTNYDRNLLFNEHKVDNNDIIKTSKFSDREFLVLVPEFATPNYIKINSFPETKMAIEISKGEEKNTERKLQTKIHTIYEDIAPEIQKIIFNLICLLREKSNKIIPEEGLEKIIDDCSKVDLLRAKEIALQESFIKKIISSPKDSSEKINWLKLTERGEEFYKGYLSLQEKIPNITFSSLIMERTFEKEILEKLEKIQLLIKTEENIAAVNLMIVIIAYMLGAFPEKDRFIRDKPASEILNYWYYLKSLQDNNEFISVKRTYKKFQSIILKGLKSLKHDFIDTIKDSESLKNSNNLNIKEVKDNLETEIEYEIDIPMNSEITKSIEEKNDNQLDDEDTLIENDEINESFIENTSSSFKDAIADLKSFGMPHLDSKGVLFTPKKSTIFDDDFFENVDDLEAFEYNPFSSEDISDEQRSMNSEKQKTKLDSLKNKLMSSIAKQLNISEFDDENFIWNVLKTRYKGKLDDGYTISEIVYTLNALYKDLKDGAIINDKVITKMIKLIYAKKLMPEQLKLDLKQYLVDNNQ